MVKSFKAILKNNSIQWLDPQPEIDFDRSVEVQITVSEEHLIPKTQSDGQAMAAALNKIAKNNNFAKINSQEWQKEMRQDRPLPNRD